VKVKKHWQQHIAGVQILLPSAARVCFKPDNIKTATTTAVTSRLKRENNTYVSFLSMQPVLYKLQLCCSVHRLNESPGSMLIQVSRGGTIFTSYCSSSMPAAAAAAIWRHIVMYRVVEYAFFEKNGTDE
jgi:hypothetical protein